MDVSNTPELQGCRLQGGRDNLIKSLKKLQVELMSCLQIVMSSPCVCGLEVKGLFNSWAKSRMTQQNSHVQFKRDKAQPIAKDKLKFRRKNAGPKV
jgi:hypothetical protein